MVKLGIKIVMVMIRIHLKVNKMNNYLYSLNQFADFYKATENGKKRIVIQQLYPDKLKISWYQTPKARVRKYFELKGDIEVIKEGIDSLMQKIPKNKRQENDKRTSIEALERFIQMRLPSILNEVDYSVIKTSKKCLSISDVTVKVAPEIVIKGTLRGKTVIGAIKIHISKNKSFDLKQSQFVATIIYDYLKDIIASSDEIVLPELCYCIDIFAGRIVSVPDNLEVFNSEIVNICNDIKRIFNAA
jgi:hypothetical protein